MPFQLNAPMELSNINARKEGKEDNKHVAVDLKLSGSVNIKDLEPLVGVSNIYELQASLWDPNDEGNVRLANITDIAVHKDTSFEHLICNAFGARMIECTAHKFSFRPHAAGAILTFTLSVPDPSENILPLAADALGDTVRVEIEPAQKDLQFEDEGQEES